ncbi:MAG: sulfotransferase domain-containing protein [Alphaproteobacteria bacterium]
MNQIPDRREGEVYRHLNSGRLDQAEALIGKILETNPDHAGMLNVLGCIAAQSDRYLDALSHFRMAHDVAPTVADFADNLKSARELALAKVQIESADGDHMKAVTALRRVMAVDPGQSRWLNQLMHCITGAETSAVLSDFAPNLDPATLGTHIVIACMPKSGSTLMNRLLQALTGWDDTYLSFAFQQNEEELHLPYLQEEATRNTVTQQHFRATEANIQLLQAFGIKPLIQVRNLYDIVVSYTDFFDAGAVSNTFFIGRWDQFERSERIDLMIDNFLPWYFAFYASWMDALAKDRLEAIVVSYEELVAAMPETVKRVADFYGLGKSIDHCNTAVAGVNDGKAPTRLNKGVSGRGAEELTAAQKDRLARLAGYYPDVDFSPVGL